MDVNRTSGTVDASHERPVFFEFGDEQLFGVHSLPNGARRGVGVVIAQGGDDVNVSFQRNRLAVRLARRLAGAGYDVFRADYHGLGESTGEIDELHLDRPFVGDVRAAAQWLGDNSDVDGIVVIGSCFGARTVLAAAPEIPRIAGVVASTPPTASYERQEAGYVRWARDKSTTAAVRGALKKERLMGWFDAMSRRQYIKYIRAKLAHLQKKVPGRRQERDITSPNFSEPLIEMDRRRVPTLITYGDDDPLIREFNRTRAGKLGDFFERAKTVTIVEDLPGELHGFVNIPGQEAFLDVVHDWMVTNVPGKP